MVLLTILSGIEALQPGKYKLTLQASNVGNEFNSPIKILFINISPAFWNTWWFRTLVAILVLGIFYLVVRYRTQQRFKLQLERSGKEKQIAEIRQKATRARNAGAACTNEPAFYF